MKLNTDLKAMSVDELNLLAADLRERIIDVLSKNGGHLSSNLGAIELSIAMHFVFDPLKDPFIYDVSHQSYAHKLLSGKEAAFETLRRFGGLSGYTKESEGDYFVAGHSSTSISLAIGAAKAIALKGEDRLPVAMIGDGALSAGLAYEGLNELGDRKYPCVIILNDNEMSISKPIGAISKYLSQAMATQFYQKFKSRVEKMLEFFPDSASYMAKRFEEGFKLITPGMFFEELGLEYIGPLDGHNIAELISALKVAKAMKKPVVVHAQTIKGKGYAPAQDLDPKWHGVGPFDIKTGESLQKSSSLSCTQIFSRELLRLADEHENVVGVTAAMPSGTGMDALIAKYPLRFWDVAIAEQHAVCSMGAMAKEGFKPYIAIYSTFMQRAYDQVIHDLAIMNLSCVLAMDRAGLVGEDGETHQGVFDISFLACVPNLTLIAPRDEASFIKIMDYSYLHKGVLALRYPRGSFLLKNRFEAKDITLGKAQVLENASSRISFLGFGSGVGRAALVKDALKGVEVNLIDLVFAKPLDEELLEGLACEGALWFVFSDSAKIGGVGDLLSSFVCKRGLKVKIISFEFEDIFIEHGSTKEVEKALGIDTQSLVNKVLNNI